MAIKKDGGTLTDEKRIVHQILTRLRSLKTE